MENIKPVDGQCGTCAFADSFDYGPGPSDPEDGVHCTSLDHARALDKPFDDNPHEKQLTEFGYIDLFRFEVIADEGTRCPCWKAKDEKKV